MFSVFVAYFIVDICFSCLRCVRACVLMDSLGLHVRFDGFAWFARHAVIASFFKEIVKNSTSKKKFSPAAPQVGGVPPTPPQPLARGSAPRSRRLLLLQTLYVNLNILQQLRDFSRFFPRAEPRGRGVDFQDCENLPLVKIKFFSRFSNFFLNFYRKSRFNFIFCDNFGSITIGEN